MTDRDFNFPMTTLLRDAKRLLSALRDPVVGPPVTRRLVKKDLTLPVFDVDFEKQIGLVEKGGQDQSGAVGNIGELTQEQAEAFTEMERLLSAARRSAGLAFPTNDVRLRAEFQVGVHEPQDFGSEIDRAGQPARRMRMTSRRIRSHSRT